MAHSKNDFDCMGSTCRLKMHKVKDQYDAILMIVNPSTGKPYTYEELEKDLQTRKKDYPMLEPLITVALKSVAAATGEHPERVYSRTCRGKDKAAAEKRINKEVLPHIKELVRLLFRPQWEVNLEMGNVTIFQYAEYMQESLFSGSKDRVQRLTSALQKQILPVVGNIRLSDFDKEEQQKAIRAINRNAKSSNHQESSNGYIKSAYEELFKQIEKSYQFYTSPLYLAEQIDVVNRKNNALRNGFKVDRLDSEDRERLFKTAAQQDSKLDLLLLSLFYSGMSENIIPAHTMQEIVEYVLKDESVYWLTVTKTVSRSNEKHSILSVVNKKFSISEFRIVVLYPWAKSALDLYVEELKNKGFTQKQIAEMKLSGINEEKGLVWPEEIVDRLERLMKKAEIPDTVMIRTRKSGKSYLEKVPVNIQLLRRDAETVATYCCGASTAMLHAMFGKVRTEVDEESYLGLYSPQYTVCRYLHLRRFSPFEAETEKASSGVLRIGRMKMGKYRLRVQNDTEKEQMLKVNGDFAFTGQWRENK